MFEAPSDTLLDCLNISFQAPQEWGKSRGKSDAKSEDDTGGRETCCLSGGIAMSSNRNLELDRGTGGGWVTLVKDNLWTSWCCK